MIRCPFCDMKFKPNMVDRPVCRECNLAWMDDGLYYMGDDDWWCKVEDGLLLVIQDEEVEQRSM